MAGGSFDVSELLGEFRDEASVQLDVLDEALLSVERTGELDESEVEEVRRALHTLKGNAGMLGLVPVRDAVHGLEEVFKRLPSEWGRGQVDRLFEMAARLRDAIKAAGTDAQAEAFGALGGVALSVEPGGVGPTQEAGTGAAGAAGGEEEGSGGARDVGARGTSQERIRIPFRRLDELLNQSSQLAGVSLVFDDLLRRNRATLKGVGLWDDLSRHRERLGRLVYEMRRGVMDLRLVPISVAFSRFPRVARDLATDSGKRVEVVLRGERTELDKSTVDQLSEPLLHLVRNAIDHGIEAPEEREAKGKPPAGRLVLSARQEGERIRIEVEDDGRGLDMDAIVRKARERGVIGPDEDPGRPVRLIFRPGFSTAARESTVSGRGVGLDVVRRQVQAMRGEVRVEDGADGGTRFVLDLPLTVAVTSAVLFEESGQILALPASAVETTLRPGRLERLGRAEVVRHEGGTVPVARPGRLFGWNGDGDAATRTADDAPGVEKGTAPVPYGGLVALIVRRAGGVVAVVADRVVDQREVLVKHLPPFLGRPPGVTGVTVTATGRAVFLLDPDALLELSAETQRHGA